MPASPPSDVTSPGVDWVPITLSGDNVDLLSTSGPTGGIIARSLYITVAGNVVFETLGGGAGVSRTVTVPANFYLSAYITKIYSAGNGTTATGVFAIL